MATGHGVALILPASGPMATQHRVAMPPSNRLAAAGTVAIIVRRRTGDGQTG